jgi:hypothetical protein
VPAAPSSPSVGRTSGRASVPSQARNAASRTTSITGKPAGQPLMIHFEPYTHTRAMPITAALGNV